MAAYHRKHKSYCDKQQWLRYTLFHSPCKTREEGGKEGGGEGGGRRKGGGRCQSLNQGISCNFLLPFDK